MKKLPDPYKEYILMYDYYVATNGPAEPDDPIYEKYSKEMIPQDTVVVNVHLKRERSALNDTMGSPGPLQFMVKETGKTYTTQYGYMFADNTPENLEKLLQARRLTEEHKKLQTIRKKALDAVLTVRGPFEGYKG